MNRYLVTASWEVRAIDAETAINTIENAVACSGSASGVADLNDSEAELLDGEEEEEEL